MESETWNVTSTTCSVREASAKESGSVWKRVSWFLLGFLFLFLLPLPFSFRVTANEKIFFSSSLSRSACSLYLYPCCEIFFSLWRDFYRAYRNQENRNRRWDAFSDRPTLVLTIQPQRQLLTACSVGLPGGHVSVSRFIAIVGVSIVTGWRAELSTLISYCSSSPDCSIVSISPFSFRHPFPTNGTNTQTVFQSSSNHRKGIALIIPITHAYLLLFLSLSLSLSLLLLLLLRLLSLLRLLLRFLLSLSLDLDLDSSLLLSLPFSSLSSFRADVGSIIWPFASFVTIN